MKKTILYRLFGLGAIPRRVRPVLEKEGVLVLDEGMGGWFITRNVKAPGKRYVRRSEGFSGSLAVTKKRIVCFTYWKRQMNISVDDSKLSSLYVNTSNEQTLSISFASSDFRKAWQGVIEFRFTTEKARRFQEVLTTLGARPGTADRKSTRLNSSHYS